MRMNQNEPCPLCRASIRREVKAHPDRSSDIIDCVDCGVYEIGRATRATLGSLRDEPFIHAKVIRIQPANENGYVFQYPSGALIPDHPWLVGRRPTLASSTDR
jgi:hypothetical protein